MRELGQTIRKAREATGLSQSELASVAGVSQGAISRLETGRGLATPLLVVLKTAIALRDAALRVDPAAMPQEMALLVDSLARVSLPRGNHG
jgi:transcriptional regulator with XRE-family HTH domain